ncbi:MAG: LacI family transcriptional regulator [Chitinophagaceae bacterium]|jgi:LacI family transcriptional regulator|nr:LacI family transcriptional regulator [Chitinophagaceae bacterium]
MKKGVTIKEIAIKLHMSVSTVSKALNNDPEISVMTKERVKKLAEEWDYIPNEAARHFKMNKTFSIGVIVPNLIDQFFVLAINGIQKVATEFDYNLIISQSNEDAVLESKILDLMKRNRVDGIIITITKHTKDLTIFHKVRKIGIPLVFISRQPYDTTFDYVITDNEGGAFKATEFLIKKGHKQIGHLMGPTSLEVSKIRFDGYKNALKKYNIPLNNKLIKVVDFTKASTQNAMKYFLSMQKPPTGIFAFKNYLSLDAQEYVMKKYKQLNTSIDFVGFGNLPLLRYINYKPVAAIDENSFGIGHEAAKILFEKINESNKEESTVKQIKIPCKLIPMT